MTKLAAMAINNKKPLKIFFYRTRGHIILKIIMKIIMKMTIEGKLKGNGQMDRIFMSLPPPRGNIHVLP